MDFEYPAEARGLSHRTKRQFLDEELPPWWTDTWVDDDRIMPVHP